MTTIGCASNIVVVNAFTLFRYCSTSLVFNVAVRCGQQSAALSRQHRWRALCGQEAEAHCIQTLPGRVPRREMPAMTLDGCGWLPGTTQSPAVVEHCTDRESSFDGTRQNQPLLVLLWLCDLYLDDEKWRL